MSANKLDIKQLLKFGTVGCLNLVIGYAFYALCVFLKLHYQIGNLVGFITSSLNGFICNKYWTFGKQAKKEQNTKVQIVKYYAVYGSSLLITMLFSYVFIDTLKVNEYIAPFLISALTIPYNFFLSKYWVYK